LKKSRSAFGAEFRGTLLSGPTLRTKFHSEWIIERDEKGLDLSRKKYFFEILRQPELE